MNQWISVKDRLPERDGFYLVWAPDYWGSSKVLGLEHLACSKFSLNYEKHWGIERGAYRWDGKITHWTPLPEPPQKEDEA